MHKRHRTRTAKAGLPPGSLIHVGERHTEAPRLTLMSYGAQEIREEILTGIDRLTVPPAGPHTAGTREGKEVSWLHVEGLHDVALMEKLGTRYRLHPLTQEDILFTDQRPKTEDFGSYIYVVLKSFSRTDGPAGELVPEQISIVFGGNFLISFAEKESALLAPIRERIRQGRGRIAGAGADYLAYAIIDTIVDQYFLVLERFGEEIEDLEGRLVTRPGGDSLAAIQHLKREMLYLRKSVWPLREAVSALQRLASPLMDTATDPYLKDVYDHTIQIIDTIETMRDSLAGMLDIYLSSASNRLNEVMKVLTIIATIFMPLTFLAGVYGMNFRYMPELEWHWGYFTVWGVMIAVALGMALYFKRKKWL
ncbi:MAG TPA: magnesium/cobalt transporter CorA [Syntrophales bacterium]|nr:magnesium/cobalt transporter CorA [Syntrophales bacterium]HON22914.1 magnesium/cobalt transporter CorA [Syntrophales bacterium]HOU78772.1 magnesium/cobalt transporter CorA [Syntrophales bacterium]HPC31511.1 magnesium/cobalt transporter CorA [Syntrophales bacterium]HQI34813.1 magnesium/cobalt transporter CorA [Syntrophales bacterium]